MQRRTALVLIACAILFSGRRIGRRAGLFRQTHPPPRRTGGGRRDRRHGSSGRTEDERKPPHHGFCGEQSRRQFHSGFARTHGLSGRRPYPLFHFDQHADHPAVASGLSVRSHATDTCHASRDRTADPGREEQPGHQDAGRVDQPRQDKSGQAQLRCRWRDRKLPLFRDRTAEGEDRDQDHHRQLPRSRAGAQRSARWAHRRDVRCNAGHGGTSQGGQGHAARGHQHHAFPGPAQCPDDPRVGRAGLRDGGVVRHTGARRHTAGDRPTPARRGGEGRGSAGCRFDAGLARHGAARHPTEEHGPTT